MTPRAARAVPSFALLGAARAAALLRSFALCLALAPGLAAASSLSPGVPADDAAGSGPRAVRVVLGTGDSVDLVGPLPSGPEGRESLSVLRVKGHVLAITSVPSRCGLRELKVASGEVDLKLRWDPAFAEEKLAVPFWAEVDGTPGRFAVDADGSPSPALRKAQELVEGLPGWFREGLQAAWSLASSNVVEGAGPDLLVLAPLFAERPAPADVTDQLRLSAAETAALEAAAGR